VERRHVVECHMVECHMDRHLVVLA
jgi:hypothetical protein